MDPMSWRLPSGKALAEFALQAGFVAPLMLGGPRFKGRKKMAQPGIVAPGVSSILRKEVGEEPVSTGTFREAK